jgi:hypothetical protein
MLQEGILPQPDQVYVQFADQAINLRTLLARLLQIEMCHDLEQTTRVLLWHRFDVAEMNGPNRLLRMARHFQARQTFSASRHWDTPLAGFPCKGIMQQCYYYNYCSYTSWLTRYVELLYYNLKKTIHFPMLG